MEGKSSPDKLALAAEHYAKEGDYWLNKLAGDLIKTNFPYDYKRNREKRKKTVMETVKFTFPKTLVSRSLELSGGSDVKLHMILVTGLFILSAKYLYNRTGSHDIMMGSPILKQEAAGEFINTVLVFRNPVQDEMSFKELLLQVRETIVKANENQNYPIEILIDRLNLPAVGNEFPLFDVVVLLENLHDKSYIQSKGIHYHMMFSFSRTGESIEGVVEYDALLYRGASVKRITGHYLRILKRALLNMDLPLARLEFLPDAERREVLSGFNRTEADYPRDKTLDRLFAEQAERTPDNIAVTGGRAGHEEVMSVTYKELAAASIRLARELIEKGAGPETIIGLLAGRSIEMIIGILAILKSRGAYLPIDPDYPGKRIAYMLADSAVGILVTTREGLAKVDVSFAAKELPAAGGGQPAAYVMYTSGSTGMPKGVLVEHRNVVRLVKNTNYVELSEVTRILQTGAPGFDAATFEIYGALLNGGRLVLENKDVIMNAAGLASALKKHRVNVLWLTAPLFNHLAQQDSAMFSPLEWLLVGGDVLSPAHINLVRNKNKNLKVINGYGPTENTTFSTTYLIDRDFEENIPIGKPISNSTAYILNNNNQLQPVGVAGELVVGGDGAARGYLNNPELTAERFCLRRPGGLFLKKPPPWTPRKNFCLVSQKFCGGPGGGFSKEPPGRRRHYQTGDLARWLDNGNIEFLGRVDLQVKIRGYRIELEEIEKHLLRHKEIKEAVVAAKLDETGGHYLCAYIVAGRMAHSAGREGINALREYLAGTLPDYMIPSYFVPLDAIPLTANGKVDRESLPGPEIERGAKYIPPRDEWEDKLTEIWSGVLGTAKDKIGIDDNFFTLGGHSLKGIFCLSKIHREFYVRITLAEMFETPTIRTLAAQLREAAKDGFVSVEAVEKKEFYPLSSPQKRLYVIQRMYPGSVTYNIPTVTELDGGLDREKIKTVFEKLLERHESLRTSFEIFAGPPVQKVHSPRDIEITIEYYDPEDTGSGKNPSTAAIQNSFIRPFNLAQAPLLRVGLIHLEKENRCILMVDMHHIVSDGLSMEILSAEFMRLYRGETLSPLKLQYKDFPGWQVRHSGAEAMKKQEEFWLKVCEGEITPLKIPMDYPRPPVQSFEGSSLLFKIDDDDAEKLRELAKKENVTMFMLFLALLNILLAKISSRTDIMVGTAVAGRKHADLEPIIGMFVNTLVLRNFPTKEKTFISFLKEVKQRVLGAFDNQDYPFEDLVDKVLPERDANRNPLFDIMYSFASPDPEVPAPSLEEEYHDNVPIKFDLMVIAGDTGRHMYGTIGYRTKLFKKETIRRFITYLKEIISIVSGDAGIVLKTIEISTGLEYAASEVYDQPDEFEF